MSSTAHTAASGRRLQPAQLIRLDALVSGLFGLALAIGSPALDGLLGVRPAVLVPLGLALVAYAAALELLARRGAPPAGVKLVIAGNAAWVVVSVVVVVTDVLTLTTAGTVIAVLQAVAVAVLAELQLQSIRKS